MQGLIIENISNLYKVKSGENVYTTTARGKFKKDEIIPVVGDFVELAEVDNEKMEAVIDEILPRKNYVKRPKVSNITQLVFVLSSKHPKPDLLMLDKQLAFAEFLNIKSIIVLNKIDLDEKTEFKTIKKIYENVGYKVIETQANEGNGVKELVKLMKNNINVFSGNSGVGKSTLINSIFNENVTLEGEISQKNKRGKNTTTSIKLYEIDKDTYIADTPGFSTFEISEIESNQLENCFKEFKQYIPNCEFVGCTHIKEGNCGIKQAVEEGKINLERYNRFIKIYSELKDKESKKW
ncbi:MAG: ribosome small subunit-dependent GTPase A [Clostridia bacterium]|nr:ribosome small subunit-dependent GTPase A [Clostridia bacterium]